MKIEVVMPQLGESVVEGTVVKWLKAEGDRVEKDEPIVEISTDKVDTEIPAPVGGVLSKIVTKEGEKVQVGTVLAFIETEAVREVPARPKPRVVKEEAKVVAMPERARPIEEAKPTRFYSPLVKSIARAEGISMQELEIIPGTGLGGRVTKRDILAFMDTRKVRPVVAEYPDERVEIIPMDVMRKTIAEHMVRSVHTSAHVTTVSEVELSKLVQIREKIKDEFVKKEGFGLTYTPFFVRAIIPALKEFPWLNASVEGDKIVVKKFINIGVAVALERGLIVPVVKGADGKSFVDLARAIHDLSQRARMKQLQVDDVHGGTFTITNPGMFGNLLGTPIINQPQVAILAIGAIKKRVVAIDDAIAVRPMAFLSLTYDHRIIDGAMGGMFLQRVVELLEKFDETWVTL